MINSNNRCFYYCLLLAVFYLSGASVLAQDKDKGKYKNYNKEFCSNNWSNGDKVSFHEVRETTVSTNSLTVDGKRNGGISVRGENRSDILIKACVQTWSESDEAARLLAKSIRIETGSTVRAEGASEDSNWSVSYQILVPHSTNLNLTTLNGGIGISNVEGNIEFEAKNGGIHLRVSPKS